MARLSRLTLIAALALVGSSATTPSSRSRSRLHNPNLNIIARREGEEACNAGTNIPNLWSISDLTVAYTEDETVRKGNASFTVTDTRSKRVQHLQCTLRFNYLCEFLGTPEDKELYIWVQVNLLAAAITVTQPWSCEGISKSQVTGTADVPLVCPDRSLEEGLACKSGNTPSLIDGSVVLLDSAEPVPQPEPNPAPVLTPRRRRRGRQFETQVLNTERRRFNGENAHVQPRALHRRGSLPPPPPPLPPVPRKPEIERAPYPIPERDIKAKEYTPNPLSGSASLAMHNRLMGMARRGRAMAHALAHYDLRHREPENISPSLSPGSGHVDGKDKKEKESGDGDTKGNKSKEQEQEGKKEPLSEKTLIDELEHRLCSPSCLRETTPGPESGREWTDSGSRRRIKIREEMEKRNNEKMGRWRGGGRGHRMKGMKGLKGHAWV